MNYIWIVEMRVGKNWLPTTGAGLVRVDAAIIAEQWRENNPDDKFRVRKYEARREP